MQQHVTARCTLRGNQGFYMLDYQPGAIHLFWATREHMQGGSADMFHHNSISHILSLQRKVMNTHDTELQQSSVRMCMVVCIS